MAIAQKKRRSKVVSMEEAAGMIKDGMMIAVGGCHSHEAPAAMVRELIRRRVKDLTVVPSNAAGYQVDVLLGAGCVKTLYVSYIGLDYIGTAPNFRRMAESGRLNVIEFDEMGLLRGLKASAAGVAFFPLPDGFRGTDHIKANPEFYREINDPYTGKKVVVMPPIRPEIAIIHVGKCDEYGNAQEMGMIENLLHQASNKVIMTTDEIVPLEDTQAHYKEVTIFGKFVVAVVKAPYGAHPGQCSGHYQHDEEHLKEYQQLAKDDAGMKKYLDAYVYGVKNHEEYLQKIGMSRLLSLKYY